MIQMIQIDDQAYYIDGEITDDDFFINTDSEHFDPADVEAGREAAVYSVPVSLKQSVLDELAKSKYVLESGVIGSFECTRLIHLVSMRIDADRTEVDGEMEVTEEGCEAANQKMREWQKSDMEPRVSQVKKQLKHKVNMVIESNNQECLEALLSKLTASLVESNEVAQLKQTVASITKEFETVKRHLEKTKSKLAAVRKRSFVDALTKGDLDTKDLPETVIDALKSMA